MKRKILIVLVVLLGVGFFAYPYAANHLSVLRTNQVILDYDTSVADMLAQRRQERWEEAENYNRTLTGGIEDPFAEGAGEDLREPYYELLNVEEHNAMGHISIPAIKVRMPIYHGTSEAVLQEGAGHLKGSSLPVGGLGQHSVITGHTGLVKAKYFTDLVELKEGDVFYLHVLEEILAYKVDQIQVVLPDETEGLKRVEGADYCTLITCTPYGVNSHRLLVRGSRIPYEEDPDEEAFREELRGLSEIGKLVLYSIVGTVLALIVLVAVVKKRKGKERRRKRYWWEEE